MRTKIFTLVPAALIAAVLGFGLIAGQSTAAADDEAATPKTDPMQFVNGSKTWANTCARCHNMRDPKSLRDDQWRAAMAHMRVRAHLTEKEAEDVLAFLQQSN